MPVLSSSLVRTKNVLKLLNSNFRYSVKVQRRRLSDKQEGLNKDITKQEVTTDKSGDISYKSPHELLRPMIAPSKFQKKVLVWGGKYKNESEVPSRISLDTLDRATNKTRIKFANYMIIATIFGCIFMAVSGRRAAERGESVQKMNLDWHKEMNKKFEEEEAAAALAKNK